MTSIKILTTVFFSLFLIHYSAIAGVYKWTDANGKIHFSDKPHKNADEIIINTAKPSGLGTSNNQLKRQKELLLNYQNDRLAKQKKQRRNNKRNEKTAKKCQQLRDVILNYEEADYLYNRDNNGKKRRLSGDNKKKETAILKKAYDAQCIN